MADLSDEDLLAALGVEAEPVRQSSRSAHEERIIAGFEDIQKFVDQHGRVPARPFVRPWLRSSTFIHTPGADLQKFRVNAYNDHPGYIFTLQLFVDRTIIKC